MNRNLITLGKSTTANAQSSSVLHVGLPQAIDRTDPDGVDAALAFATKPLKKLFEIILTLMSLGIVTSVFTYDKDGKGKKVDLPKLDTSDEEGMKKAVDQCCGLADDFVRTWRNPEDHSENLGMVSVELVGWFPRGRPLPQRGRHHLASWQQGLRWVRADHHRQDRRRPVRHGLP